MKRALLVFAPLLLVASFFLAAFLIEGWTPQAVAHKLSTLLFTAQEEGEMTPEHDIAGASLDAEAPAAGEKDEEKGEPEYREAVVLAVGDIMVHQTQYRQAHLPEKGSYDFSPSFEIIAPYIREADLAVGNLETTLGGGDRGYSAYPLFNSPDEIAYALKEAGFDLLCTANNHSLDTGERGLYRTIEVIEETGMKPFGTARSKEERDTPLLVETNGIELAFLAYTYCTNMIPVPEGREYIVNLIDRERIEEDIRRARQRGADLVIIYMHWGHEYHDTPSEEQKELARFIAEAGGDIIIGSHPHVIQPMEIIQAAKEDGAPHETFVAYSLGNFISNQHKTSGIPTRDVKFGKALRLHLRKNMESGEVSLEEADYLLTWVHRHWRHRIIPLHKAAAGPADEYNLSSSEQQWLEEKWDQLTRHLEGFEPAASPAR